MNPKFVPVLLLLGVLQLLFAGYSFARAVFATDAPGAYATAISSTLFSAFFLAIYYRERRKVLARAHEDGEPDSRSDQDRDHA